MQGGVLPYFLAAWLFLVGLYGVVTSRNFVQLVMCLSVVQSSTYVLILEVGYKVRATAPIFKGIPGNARAVDPVVQSLVLTDSSGIVFHKTVDAATVGGQSLRHKVQAIGLCAGHRDKQEPHLHGATVRRDAGDFDPGKAGVKISVARQQIGEFHAHRFSIGKRRRCEQPRETAV